MKSKLAPQKPTAPDRAALLKSIRAAVKAHPGRHLSTNKFIAVSKFTKHRIFRHFPRWTDALLAAGFKPRNKNYPVTDAELFADWARLVRKFRRLPTNHEYSILGKHASCTFAKRFGGWAKISEAFRDFARGKKAWRDVLAFLPPSPGIAPRSRTCPGVATQSGTKPDRPRFKRQRSAPTHHRSACGTRLSGRPTCGPRIHLESLSHAPVNEAGVLFLFALMARELGFVVESLRAGYPDCEAKRLIAPDAWQTVRIEFEYASRNFRDHGHDAGQCDIIVCYHHNWPECPIEVLELSKEVERQKPCLERA